jgi:hypothetical protein
MLTKLLTQLGLDPGNVTFDAIFSRLTISQTRSL